MKNLLLTLALLATTATTALASSKDFVGTNENYISGNLLYRGFGCGDAGCPSNTNLYTIDTIKSELDHDAIHGHRFLHREIIPVTQLRPTQAVNRYAEVADVVRLYSDLYKRNGKTKLVIALGITVPYWMGAQNNWQPMPMGSDAARWSTMKNGLAWTVGELYEHLWNDPNVDNNFLTFNVFWEPFNEFDALKTSASTVIDATEHGRRSQDLHGGVYWVLAHKGLPNNGVTMPSYVGSQHASVYLPQVYGSPVNQPRPNFHVYQVGDTAEAQVTNINAKLSEWKQYIPSHLRQGVILGETGVGESVGSCAASGAPNKLKTSEYNIFHSLLADRVQAPFLLFWRSHRTSFNGIGCEGYFGLRGTQADGNLSNYLNN